MLELSVMIVFVLVICKSNGVIFKIIRVIFEGLSWVVEIVSYDYIWEKWYFNKIGIVLNRKKEGMDGIYFVYDFVSEDFLILDII